MPFPIPFVPQLSYKSGGRQYGASRDNDTRKHAGADLIAPVGTEIYAIEDGIVITPPYVFFHGAAAIEILHTQNLVRYCEIRVEQLPGLNRGAAVKAGQVIGHVGNMFHEAMLHFEVYSGKAIGPLTNRNNKGYERRSDLMDPTPLLDRLSKELKPLRAVMK